jgi:hypothetical protein
MLTPKTADELSGWVFTSTTITKTNLLKFFIQKSNYAVLPFHTMTGTWSYTKANIAYAYFEGDVIADGDTVSTKIRVSCHSTLGDDTVKRTEFLKQLNTRLSTYKGDATREKQAFIDAANQYMATKPLVDASSKDATALTAAKEAAIKANDADEKANIENNTKLTALVAEVATAQAVLDEKLKAKNDLQTQINSISERVAASKVELAKLDSTALDTAAKTAALVAQSTTDQTKFADASSVLKVRIPSQVANIDSAFNKGIAVDSPGFNTAVNTITP